MRKLGGVLSAMTMLLALPAAAKTAFAHGGQYRGPAGEVPPDSRQPEDPPPPDNGGGTPTPPDNGGGTPTPPDNGGGNTPTPPDNGGTPDRPGGNTPPPPPAPGPGGGQTRTGRTGGPKGPSYESWLFWWNYNKDRIINIRKAIKSGLARGSGGGFDEVVSSGTENVAEAQNVTSKAIRENVVPLLIQYATDTKVNFSIQAAAVLSLAKIGQKDQIPLMMQMAKNRGTDLYHKEIEETAALSLGVLQDRSPHVRQFLADVGGDTTAKTRTRCFTLFSLGLLGEEKAASGYAAESYRALKAIASSPAESKSDVVCSALVAIGLLGDRAAVPDLLEWLGKESIGTVKLNDLQLSYVAAALGKIGQPGLGGPETHEVIDALRALLNRKNRLTRYSAVIALGQIAPNAEEKIQGQCVGMLNDIVKNEGKSTADSQTVNFALSALGRICQSAEGTPPCSEAVRAKAVDALRRSFDDNKQSSKFAALGLGLAQMNQRASEKAPDAYAIRTALAKASGDVEARGALCIALGLLKDIQAADILKAILQDRGNDKELRGTAALALGLIGDKSSVEVVRKVLEEKDSQKLRVDAAIAAGLLQDREAVKTLVDILKDDKASQFILGSVSTALGQIGDQRAVAPLAEILKNPGALDLNRALAAVALGQIGDKDDVQVLSRLSEDVNYRANYDAMGEVLTIL